MLPRRNRLPGALVARVLRKGHIQRGDGFTLRIFTTRLPFVRMAIVVSKKVEPKAVNRNKLRRRIFNQVRQMIQTSQHGGDYVLIMHKNKPNTVESIELCLKKRLSD